MCVWDPVWHGKPFREALHLLVSLLHTLASERPRSPALPQCVRYHGVFLSCCIQLKLSVQVLGKGCAGSLLSQKGTEDGILPYLPASFLQFPSWLGLRTMFFYWPWDGFSYFFQCEVFSRKGGGVQSSVSLGLTSG